MIVALLICILIGLLRVSVLVIFIFIVLIQILRLCPPVRDIKLFISIAFWRNVSESKRYTVFKALPFSFTSYPPCVTQRTNSALLPTFVFLPRMEPSSFALYQLEAQQAD